MTFQNTGHDGYRYWTELTGVLVPWESGEQQPVPPIPDKSQEGLQRKLNEMIYVSHPKTSQIRSALIATSLLVIEHWGWLTVPALLSVITFLIYPQLKQFVVAWLYWVSIVVATSALGMPVQRYVVVIEPLLYCLIAVSLYAIFGLRYQYAEQTIHNESGVVTSAEPNSIISLQTR
jgi:hypothetical protein